MRKNSKMIRVGISAVLSGGFYGVAHASLIASDNVTNNPPYTGYINFNGLNGGSGFGPWSATNVSGSTGGDFLYFGTPLVTPGNAGGFDIYDNGVQNGGLATDEFAAVRPFTGALAAGQAFSFIDQLHYNSNATNGGPGNLGFSLEDSSGSTLFDFHTAGGNYLLSDATQTLAPTSVSYNYNQIDTFDFTLNNVGPTTAAYTLAVSGTAQSLETYTGTISMLTGGISQAAIYNNNGGGSSDVEFDQLAITSVPEPVSLTMASAAAASLLIRRRTRAR
jgi:hypothetical protein